MKPIAHIHTDMPQKFGIPRNSFLAPHLRGTIIFEPEFALNSAVEGMEGFTYLWLIWEFENGTPGGTAADIANDVQTENKRGTTEKWFPTVRPPRLGGTKRRGGICHPQPLPSQSHRAYLRKARARRAHRKRSGHSCSGRRSARWYAYLRHKALHSLCRLPPRRTRRFHRRDALARTHRSLPR